MRFVVLLFGLLGVILTGFVGAMSAFFPKIFETFLKDANIERLAKDQVGVELANFLYTSPTNLWHGEAGLIFLIAAGLGLLGTLLALGRCGWQGALLMLIPAICAAIANPMFGPFAGVLAFAGLLSFFVFPRPINAPAPSARDDEEDDDTDKDDDD